MTDERDELRQETRARIKQVGLVVWYAVEFLVVEPLRKLGKTIAKSFETNSGAKTLTGDMQRKQGDGAPPRKSTARPPQKSLSWKTLPMGVQHLLFLCSLFLLTLLAVGVKAVWDEYNSPSPAYSPPVNNEPDVETPYPLLHLVRPGFEDEYKYNQGLRRKLQQGQISRSEFRSDYYHNPFDNNRFTLMLAFGTTKEEAALLLKRGKITQAQFDMYCRNQQQGKLEYLDDCGYILSNDELVALRMNGDITGVQFIRHCSFPEHTYKRHVTVSGTANMPDDVAVIVLYRARLTDDELKSLLDRGMITKSQYDRQQQWRQSHDDWIEQVKSHHDAPEMPQISASTTLSMYGAVMTDAAIDTLINKARPTSEELRRLLDNGFITQAQYDRHARSDDAPASAPPDDDALKMFKSILAKRQQPGAE